MAEEKKLVWLISGCSSGIGLALAKQVLSQGHSVVATARNLSTLSQIPKTPTLLTHILDVTSKITIEAVLSAAIAKFGRVDVVVNNAGYGILGDAEGTTEAEARAIMETNYWGAVHMSLEAMRVFREVNPAGEGGLIIQIGSFMGRLGFAGNAAYSSSKFALEGWTECVALEVHPDWNIRFLILELGGVATEFAASNYIHTATHPAYTAPDCPTNQLKAMLAMPETRSHWASAESVAEKIFGLALRHDLPLRLPVGADSWALLHKNVQAAALDMDQWRNY